MQDKPVPLSPVVLRSGEGYEFRVDFGLAGVPPLRTDSGPPLGRAAGPDSEKLLMAAVVNCLCGSLAFSLRKFKNQDFELEASAEGTLAHNDQGRLRVSGIQVMIRLLAQVEALRLLDRALAQFEDFCVVTQSVRAAVPVTVRVVDQSGATLWPR